MSNQGSQNKTSFPEHLLRAPAQSARAAVSEVGADEQADLIEAWVNAGNLEALAEIARDDDAPSPARKAARRWANVLKARGTKLPDKKVAARPLEAAASWTYEVKYAPPDGAGSSSFVFLARRLGNDVRVCELVLNDMQGVTHVSGGTTSASSLRNSEAEWRRNRGYLPAPVNMAWARARVAAARSQNTKSGLLPPLGVDRYGEFLEPVPASEPPHPIDEAALGEVTNPELRVANSASLHNEPEFASYLANRAMLSDVLGQVGQRLGALGHQPNSEDVHPVLKEEMDSATDRYFTPEARTLLAARMLDIAVSILHRVGKERALDVLATRSAILNAGLITQPPREIPFLRAFFDKAVAIAASQQGGKLDIPIAAPALRPDVPTLSADQLAAVQAARTEAPAAEPPAGG